jgi:pimeloyl-ACP methyl ester carboxylesterase
MRERAWAVAREFDPASCLASTTLYRDSDPAVANTAGLRRIAVPTLVVPGNDPMHPAATAEACAAVLPDVELFSDLGTLDQAISRLCHRVFG